MHNNDEIINKWLEGELSEEELLKSVPKKDVLAFKQILEEVDHWVPDHPDMSFSADSIINGKETKTVKINWWQKRTSLIAAAASLIILIVASFFYNQIAQDTIVLANQGVVKEVLLPDGSSIVKLAVGSSISWKDDDWDHSNRILQLKGKGFFDVEKGGSFIVNTSKGSVEVLGTEFEVSDNTSEFRVSCYEGRVKAVSTNSEEIILSRGEESQFENGQWNGKQRTNQITSPWLNKFSTFDNVDIIEALSTLESVYDLKVDKGDVILNAKFTGKIPHDNVSLACAIIFEVYDIDYEIVDEILYLKRK